jgi:hypothetical protein
MGRIEAIAAVQANLDTLSDERVELLAQLIETWSAPSVFSTLPPADRAALDASIDQAERGDVISWDSVKARLEAKLKAAGA